MSVNYGMSNKSDHREMSNSSAMIASFVYAFFGSGLFLLVYPQQSMKIYNKQI